MNIEYKAITDRIAALMIRIPKLGLFLQSAQAYLSSDPASSLTKSRIILEKLLLMLYRKEMKKEPSRPMIGDMLGDKGFIVKIPRRISTRMSAVRDMSNLGPHGEDVIAADAIRVMRDLIDVLEWYVANHNPNFQVPVGDDARQFLDILPQLRTKYQQYLRSEITSVRFVQTPDRCYLEITTADNVSGYLMDETSKRTDLAFISGSSTADDQLLFSPKNSITENAIRLLTNFDVVSIINCTDLFMPEAAKRIDDHWRQHRELLDNV